MKSMGEGENIAACLQEYKKPYTVMVDKDGKVV